MITRQKNKKKNSSNKMVNHSHRRHNLKTTTRKNKILPRNKPNNTPIRKLPRQLHRSPTPARTLLIRSSRSMDSRQRVWKQRSTNNSRLRRIQRKKKIRLRSHRRILRNAPPNNRTPNKNKPTSHSLNLQRNPLRILRTIRSRNSQRNNKASIQIKTKTLRHNR